MTRLLSGACSALAMKPRRHDAVVEGKGDLAYGKSQGSYSASAMMKIRGWALESVMCVYVID